jgi:hypothetical protein
VDEALALGHKVKPVLLGPVTYLWLGKVKGEQFDRLSLLNDILPVYQQVLAELAKRGIEWVQIDEPALVLELPQAWLDAFKPAYDALAGQVKLLLTTYFEGITANLDTITALPVQGLHVDLVHGKDDVADLHQRLPADWLLSAGLINGRNVWRADLTEKYAQIKDIVGQRALWIATSCSLLHSPIDLSVETRLDAEVKSWFAFALQKCTELALLRDALNSGETAKLVNGARRFRLAVTQPAYIMRRWKNVWRPLPLRTASATAHMLNAPGRSVRASICRRGRPRPSALSHRLPRSVACVWTSKKAISMRTTIAPVLRSTSSRRLLSRNV